MDYGKRDRLKNDRENRNPRPPAKCLHEKSPKNMLLRDTLTESEYYANDKTGYGKMNAYLVSNWDNGQNNQRQSNNDQSDKKINQEMSPSPFTIDGLI